MPAQGAPESFTLHHLDICVLVAYAVALVLIGLRASRKSVRGADEYFLAGRSMPLWAVAISILSTAQSAATYIGVPANAYAGDLSYLCSNIGAVLGAILLATVLVPRYYRLGVGTPYQLLESRFGTSAKLATSAAYMVGRVFASGARIYVGALPASLFIFGSRGVDPANIAMTIAGFMIFGAGISFLGGVASVIWVDVLQVAVYLGAVLVTILFVAHRLPLDFGGILEALAHPPEGAPSKLTVVPLGFDFGSPGFGFDPAAEFTILTAVIGFTLLTLASHGMDQDLVQRILTCRSAVKGSWSIISGVLIGIPAVLLFLVLGLLLSIFYGRPDLLGASAPSAAPVAREAFQTFVFREMPWGFAGLYVAGLFAVGPAGINSGLNAMASTLVSDFYRPLRAGKSEGHYLAVGRAAVAGWAVVLGLFAMLCIHWAEKSGQSLLSFVLSVMNFAYAGLLGVFFTALFTRRGNTRSVILALIAGFVVVLAFQPLFWVWIADLLPTLGPAGGASIATVREQFSWLRFSYPWHLVAGAAASFIVCAAGKDRRASAVKER